MTKKNLFNTTFTNETCKIQTGNSTSTYAADDNNNSPIFKNFVGAQVYEHKLYHVYFLNHLDGFSTYETPVSYPTDNDTLRHKFSIR